MEIHALNLSLTEEDLNDLLRKHLPTHQPIEELKLRVSPKGLTIAGVYPLFINVHFETQWQIGLDQGQVTARLDSFKAMGVPGNIFKSAIVKVIEDVARSEKWIRIQGDTMWVDIDACIATYAFSAHTHLRHLECHNGRITLEGSAE